MLSLGFKFGVWGFLGFVVLGVLGLGLGVEWRIYGVEASTFNMTSHAQVLYMGVSEN